MATPNNLPAEISSFVGREPQLAELRRLLHRSRAITLTGPGGAGKSRLALRLASQSLDKYPDGVWLIDVAPIAEARLLENSLAAACGIKEDSTRPLIDVLSDGLAPRRTLIVLDGCEHLVDSCAELADRLLKSCPKLSMIATSRETLGIAGEVIWRTPSLTIPRAEDAGRPELLMESEAIRLFVDRARLSRSDFELQRVDTIALAQICTRLEGIPLAIELAAGLLGVMSLGEILERLGHRFRLLTGGSRTSLPRHQTLRQAVDWSYGLLDRGEQALFARLAVFAGGFDLAAAEAVVHGEPIGLDDVLRLLSRLVQKSLVVADPGRLRVTRYRMLDTIREYALEKLQQVGEAEWRRRHADYFTTSIVYTVAMLMGAEQVAAIRRIDEEQPNIRLALDWGLSEQPESALRLAAAMGQYWWMRRSFSEGLDWLQRALSVKTSRSDLRAAALVARARLSRRIGDYSSAMVEAEEGARLARELDSPTVLARAVTILGIVASHRGDLEEALEHFQESGRLAEAAGDLERTSSSLNNVALIESALGQQEVAVRHVEAALAAADQTGDKFQRANILDTMGRINFRLGRYDVAQEGWREAILVSSEFEDSMNIADCLEGYALLAMAANNAARNVVLIAAADSIRAATGAERTAEWAVEVDESHAKARARLGSAAADAARARGAAMSVAQAVAFAVGAPTEDRRSDGSRLTGREAQVARLIAEGLTNGEVGGRLGISQRTVDAHVEHIRNKVGLRTRAQIAVWARERLGTA